MHACILLMMLVMMTLLMLRVMMCNLYKLFVLAIHSTSSPPVTTISGAKKNIEVNYDSITSCQSNHKYNSDNEIYQFFVGGEIFTVKSCRLAREFDKSRELLQMLRRFARKDGIIAIGEFTSQEFEYFLDVLHNDVGAFSGPSPWLYVLKVADYLGFASVRALAVKHLAVLLSSERKICYAGIYNVDEWLTDAYRDICTAPHLPDCTLLPGSTVAKISQAREKLAVMGATRDVPEWEKHAVIDAIFGRALALAPPVYAARPAPSFAASVSVGVGRPL